MSLLELREGETVAAMLRIRELMKTNVILPLKKDGEKDGAADKKWRRAAIPVMLFGATMCDV